MEITKNYFAVTMCFLFLSLILADISLHDNIKTSIHSLPLYKNLYFGMLPKNMPFPPSRPARRHNLYPPLPKPHRKNSNFDFSPFEPSTGFGSPPSTNPSQKIWFNLGMLSKYLSVPLFGQSILTQIKNFECFKKNALIHKVLILPSGPSRRTYDSPPLPHHLLKI